MNDQPVLTICVALLTIAVTASVLWTTVLKTPKHGFACIRCGKDVPANAAKCPACGTPVAERDQIL